MNIDGSLNYLKEQCPTVATNNVGVELYISLEFFRVKANFAAALRETQNSKY